MYIFLISYWNDVLRTFLGENGKSLHFRRGSKTFNLTTIVSHGSMVSGNLTRSLRLGFEEAFWVVQTGCIYAIIYQSYPQVTYIVCIFVYICMLHTLSPALKIAYMFFFLDTSTPHPGNWSIESTFSALTYSWWRDAGQPGQRAPGCLGYIGHYTTHLCVDYIMSHHRDPY